VLNEPPQVFAPRNPLHGGSPSQDVLRVRKRSDQSVGIFFSKQPSVFSSHWLPLSSVIPRNLCEPPETVPFLEREEGPPLPPRAHKNVVSLADWDLPLLLIEKLLLHLTDLGLVLPLLLGPLSWVFGRREAFPSPTCGV